MLTIEINGQQITADMDAWQQVQKAILDRIVADRKAREQQLRDAGQVWYALYWYHHSQRVVECFSRDDAEAVMDWDDQSNVGIVNPDGTFEPQLWYSADSLKDFEDELAGARRGEGQ